MVCFVKQKTAYEMRISDWSSDVCSADLRLAARVFCDWAHPQLTFAHKGDEFPGVAQGRVELAFLGIGQPCDSAIEPGEIEIAIKRDQHRAPVALPLIADNALEVAHPRPLALHLLVFAELAARTELFAVDQHGPGPALAVIAPQII